MTKIEYESIMRIIDREMAKLHFDSKEFDFEFEVMETWDAMVADIDTAISEEDVE